MEYGRFSYGLMSMVCVKRCLVTRMVYMGTRHSLQGESVYIDPVIKEKFSVAFRRIGRGDHGGHYYVVCYFSPI